MLANNIITDLENDLTEEQRKVLSDQILHSPFLMKYSKINPSIWGWLDSLRNLGVDTTLLMQGYRQCLIDNKMISETDARDFFIELSNLQRKLESIRKDIV